MATFNDGQVLYASDLNAAFGTTVASGIITPASGLTLVEARLTQVGALVTLTFTLTGSFTGGDKAQEDLGTVAAAFRPKIDAWGSGFMATSGFIPATVTLSSFGRLTAWRHGAGTRGRVSGTVSYSLE